MPFSSITETVPTVEPVVTATNTATVTQIIDTYVPVEPTPTTFNSTITEIPSTETATSPLKKHTLLARSTQKRTSKLPADDNQVHPQSSVSKKSNGDEKNQRSQPATDSAGEFDFQSSGSKKSNGDENQRSQSATDSAGEFDFQSSGSEKSNGDENQRSQSATDSASEFDPEEILFADVSNYESNIEHNINIESEFDESDEYDNTDKTDIDSQELFGVLTQLLTRSTHDKVLPVAREAETGCPPGEMFVEYIYEHDIYNQVFNSALQYRSSPVLLSLQSDINDWIVEEIYKHNLAADVNDPVRILRIVDISKEYNNNPAVRYYVSLVIRKTQIPIIRRVFALIFDKLQRQYFSTPNSEVDWSSMVSIPIQ
ncbi:unnamed protein product [Rotaria socialis]|uniref:Uncharacterized protein n=1 Tax=Rotaria socialis TaxID=392032 RepID=A0A818AAY1_9BILA|nr:unnamed protein product [Rotaria socialis]